MTRRNEARDISSQNTRNENTLSVAVTRIIDRTKRLSRNPRDLTLCFPAYAPL